MGELQPVVYLLVGLPGSGKSTYARALARTGVLRLSVDETMQALHGRIGRDYPADRHLTLLGPVVAEVRRRLAAAVRAGHSVVLDHGLGRRSERDDYKRFVAELGAEWRLLHFRVGRAELVRRIAARNADASVGVISVETLDWIAATSEEPHDEGEEVVDPDRPVVPPTTLGNGSRQRLDPGGRPVSETSTATGKVVVNRSMSLDGFVAGPGHTMDWIFDFMAPDEFPDVAAATGAMLIGRNTYDVGNRMKAEQAPDDKGYPFSGPVFVLTHQPPDEPDPTVTFLNGDISAAVATARNAAAGRNLEILGSDVAGQCLRHGLVDEILVYVVPVLLGDGIRLSSPGLPRTDLEPLSSTRSGAVTVLRFRVRK